jgi:hypothetical protein
MPRFGGESFKSFSVPLIFEERYFVREPGNPSLITVVLEVDGEPVFEILKNEPCTNELSIALSDRAGIMTVSEKVSGRFLYQVCSDAETIVTFEKPAGERFSVVISDTKIRAGGMIFNNHLFRGAMAGVLVDPEIGVGMMDPPIPPHVASWLSKVCRRLTI